MVVKKVNRSHLFTIIMIFVICDIFIDKLCIISDDGDLWVMLFTKDIQWTIRNSAIR